MRDITGKSEPHNDRQGTMVIWCRRDRDNNEEGNKGCFQNYRNENMTKKKKKKAF